MRVTIGAAIIENGRLLVVSKKGNWILPGGKPNDGESDSACLIREVGEELSGTKINPRTLEYLTHFDGISPIKRYPIRVKVYSAELDSSVGECSMEISGKAWMSYNERHNYNLSELTDQIFTYLHSKGLM